MEAIDLTKKQYAQNHLRDARRMIEKYKASENKTRFSVGQYIVFYAGYHDDIKYRSKIIAIDGHDIHVLWDCWWSPIRDDAARKIEGESAQ
jgi:hypothetical protein